MRRLRKLRSILVMATLLNSSADELLIFERGGALYERGLEEDKRAKLLSLRDVEVLKFCLSPDGGKLAFVGRDVVSGQRDFYAVDLATRKCERVTKDNSAFGVRELVWQPGRDAVVFAGPEARGFTRDLYRLNLTAGEIQSLILSPGTDEWAPCFSSEGESLAFLSDRSVNDKLWEYRGSSGELKSLDVGGSSFWEVRLPAWSPDGRFVAFYRWALDPPPDERHEPGLWLREVVTGKERFLVKVPMVFLSEQAVWSPDGEWIAYTQGDDLSSAVRLFKVATGEVREAGELAGRSLSLSWSSDSQTLFFVNGEDENAALYQLMLEPFSHRKLAWSRGCEKVLSVPDAGVRQFYRTRESKGELILESAVVSVLLKDGRTLDLVGTIHVGSEDYFRALDTKLKSYDLVLYELLGLEKGGRLPPYQWSPRDSLLKKKLGLRYQSTAMNYSAPSFRHADLDSTAFERFLGKVDAPPGDEALLELFQRASSPEDRRGALLEEVGQYSVLLGGGQFGSTLEAARHEVVMEALQSESAGENKKIAILYGASHLGDLLQRLQPTRVLKVEWLRAW